MRLSVIKSWVALLILTGVLTAGMRLAHLPGALMLGPMFAGMIVALNLPTIKLPKWTTIVAQGVLGCLIASVMPPEFLVMAAPFWPLIVGMNLLQILGIFGLGVVATRMRWFPGTAGIWGMAPGGASAMIMLSDEYGSDKQLVALMHYMRLICSVLVVIMMALLIGTARQGDPGVPLPGMAEMIWFPPVDLISLATMAVIIVIGILLSRALGIAIFVIFVPLFCGIALQMTEMVTIEVPPIASTLAFAVIGWHVGLSFTRSSLLYCAKLIPRILMSVAAILCLCVGLSFLLAKLWHVDFLTAYMALNPGGVDVVLLTASTINVDLTIIMTMQITRLILAIAIAPSLARFAAIYLLKAKDAKR
ncbi:MAG: AbrB family transcriptional regulator [Emcibacter sp.]|nr:AbrB family transcriptional regulator [Emcibacter sp.]